MIIKKLSLCLLLVLPILVFFSLPSLATQGRATTDGTRVRREASTEATILTDVQAGETFEILDQIGDWYQVQVDEYVGYIRSDLVEILQEENVTPTEATQEQPVENTETQNEQPTEQQNPEETKNEISVYIIPVIYASKTDIIPAGTEIITQNTINNWCYVQYGEKTGWVIKTELEKLNQTPSQEEPQEPVETSEEKKGYINTSSANVRASGDMEAEVLKAIPRNTEVIILEEGEEWTKIRVDDLEGYVATRLISSEPTETTSRALMEQRDSRRDTYYISVSSANIRQESNTSSQILGTLSKNTEVIIVGEEGDFYKIEFNGDYAYISKDLVADHIENTGVTNGNNSVENPPANSSGQSIVDYAMQFKGYPYVYGGTTPSGGFDCSGFTYYVYNQCGYSLSRSCSIQASSGVEVGRDYLQPGDLLYFAGWGTSELGHVGIYIGNSQFIHAANETRGVVIDTISSGYYNEKYMGARRF